MMIDQAQFLHGLKEITVLVMRQSAANMLLVGGQALSSTIIALEQAARCYLDSGDEKLAVLYREFAAKVQADWQELNRKNELYWAQGIAGVQREALIAARGEGKIQ